MITVPKNIKPGDKIGIVCPAGYMEYTRIEACKKQLEEWGFEVVVGKTVGSSSETYFSGTDEERLEDLQQMMDDSSIKAIVCGRGGYGTVRIVDQISFKKFKKRPKWIVGYSDITILLNHLLAKHKIASIHGPMAGAFNNGEEGKPFNDSLLGALTGKRSNYVVEPHPYNKKGVCVGELTGGNLSLLVNTIGTKSEVKTKNKILFIEEVGELKYTIDRMFWQLKRAGKFDDLSGLIIGGFSETRDTVRPYGKDVIDIIHEIVKDYPYPICYGFPVSHEKDNVALRIGMGHRLRVGSNKVILD
ncbi:S66 peptidase family protein [Gynurincola endophyticus]|uniref:S66 peptidase family protein n=1 Tax=Gynurincola endophyticus TaxID=2479004 RepID=UPI000F8F3BCB|nr:LD-carboxypeptidase [Gynurincola endophyticus]